MRCSYIIIAVFLILSSSLWALDVSMTAPDYAVQGELIQIVIYGDSLTDISVSLQDSSGTALSKSEGFIWSADSNHHYNIALLGIPSTAQPGRYRLTVKAMEAGADWDLNKTIAIREFDYPETVITLSDAMNSIYSDNSERKKQEAREYWALISTFDQKAMHHYDVFTNPIEGNYITSRFGSRRRYKMPDGSETSSVHYGRDLRGETGTPVYAPGRGRVVMAKDRLVTGKSVILEHLPGFFSLYYHMDSIEVQLGQMVSQGELIGSIGMTGFATGPHLHWEIRVGGTPVSPQQFLDSAVLDTEALTGKM